MTERLYWLKRKLGKLWGLRPWERHSLVLFVSGLVFVGIGLSYILSEHSESRQKALEVVLRVVPIEVWGVAFIFSGCLSIISARWPAHTDTWGYSILTGLSAMWSATYFTGVIFNDSPTTNIPGGLIWGLVSCMWWSISGLVNPARLVVPSDELV